MVIRESVMRGHDKVHAQTIHCCFGCFQNCKLGCRLLLYGQSRCTTIRLYCIDLLALKCCIWSMMHPAQWHNTCINNCRCKLILSHLWTHFSFHILLFISTTGGTLWLSARCYTEQCFYMWTVLLLWGDPFWLKVYISTLWLCFGFFIGCLFELFTYTIENLQLLDL